MKPRFTEQGDVSLMAELHPHESEDPRFRGDDIGERGTP